MNKNIRRGVRKPRVKRPVEKNVPNKYDSNSGEGLRTFKYARGYTYLTKVVATPNVPEITDELQAM